MNNVIQGLWIGSELSVMEQLSISSFLLNGHDYHLFVYNELKNIPVGTTVKDANEILPSSSIFQYREYPTYAGFANFFRYKLLLERGGWWADADIICLKPFDFPNEHVFATEMCKGLEVVSSGIIKAPKGSPVMEYAWRVCQEKNPEDLAWGETGPKLMGQAVEELSLEEYRVPHHVFCPLDYPDWRKVLEPDPEDLINESSHSIHLWNEKWRAAGQDKNSHYDPNCLYEQLKGRYLRRDISKSHFTPRFGV